MNKLLIFIIFLLSCGQSGNKKINSVNDLSITKNTTKMMLLENVKLAINPKFRDWILFENGTYIIFDNVDTISNIEEEAIRLMKEYGPINVGTPAGDFSVTHLNKTEGWVVSGHCHGMYTYVNPAEIKSKTPSDVEIGIFGRSKREQDGKIPVIVHINKN